MSDNCKISISSENLNGFECRLHIPRQQMLPGSYAQMYSPRNERAVNEDSPTHL